VVKKVDISVSPQVVIVGSEYTGRQWESDRQEKEPMQFKECGVDLILDVEFSEATTNVVVRGYSP